MSTWVSTPPSLDRDCSVNTPISVGLQFKDSPATGSPRTARYDLVNVSVLVAPKGPLPYTVTGDQLQINRQVSGSADVALRNTKIALVLDFVAVTYHNYSDDGVHYIQGHESVASTFLSVTSARLDWYSNLTATGAT